MNIDENLKNWHKKYAISRGKFKDPVKPNHLHYTALLAGGTLVGCMVGILAISHFKDEIDSFFRSYIGQFVSFAFVVMAGVILWVRWRLLK